MAPSPMPLNDFEKVTFCCLKPFYLRYLVENSTNLLTARRGVLLHQQSLFVKIHTLLNSILVIIIKTFVFLHICIYRLMVQYSIN